MKTRVLIAVAVLAVLVSGLSLVSTARADDDLASKLTSIEKSLWEGWKNHDGAPFREHLAEGTLNVDADSIDAGKAEAIETITSSDCVVEGYSLSDVKVHRFGDHTAILTYRASQDGVCRGKKIAAAVNVSSVYVKEGDKWQAACYHETPVAD